MFVSLRDVSFLLLSSIVCKANAKGDTPLTIGALENRLEVVQQLIAFRANVNKLGCRTWANTYAHIC